MGLEMLKNIKDVVEGSLFQPKTIIFPSNFAMCHAHIR